MGAHACSMIAVWVQPAALSAVFRTQTAIMERTAEGAGRIRSARGRLPPATAPKIAERDTKPCVLARSAWLRITFSDLAVVGGRVRRCRTAGERPAPPCRHEP